MAGDDSVYTNLQALSRLRYRSAGFSYLPRQPVGSLLSGRKRSRLRGRGLDFDELRHYRPGDDIRNMDWRVTNRTGKPHVRVYSEERDRPVVIVVDQRLAMFFGSQRNMKSVTAAELAALTAWRVLATGDRVGALLFNDSRAIQVPPGRSQRSTLGWLGELVTMNRALSVDSGEKSNPDALNHALQQVERSLGHDSLVLVISDFGGWSNATLDALERMRRHNDVVCALIFDPLERDIRDASELVVSDGYYQLQIAPQEQDLGDKFAHHFRSTLDRVQAELKRHDIPVLLLDTVASVEDQVREQLAPLREPRR